MTQTRSSGGKGRVLAALAAAVALFAAGAALGATNLRFGFLTDTHVNAAATNLDRLRGAFTLFKSNDVDLVVHAGDFAEQHDPTAYTAISNLFDEVFGAEKPRFIGVVGNHDTQMNLGDLTQLAAAEETLALVGVENAHTDVKTIGGYTFLTMPYAIGSTDQGFLSWADYETAVSNACVAAGAGKPVFLLEHEPPQDTVYNSHNWGYAKSREILARYPQVVELSGHVHGSLHNDLFLWQGAFTVLNAGCLQVWNGLLNGVAAPAGGKQAYDALVVDVEDARIVAVRRDVTTGEEIDPEHRWVIPLPFDAATAPYDRAKLTAAEVAPAFGADDALAVTPGSTYTSFTLAFPEVATNAMTYWITVEKWDNGSWTGLCTQEVFSEFWKQSAAKTGHASVTVTNDAFEPGAEYRFSVQPVGQYGAKGAAIAKTAVAAKAGETPDGLVDYVRTTGGQYFDTGIIGRSGTKAEIDFSLDKVGDDWSILDCRKDENDTRFFLFHTSAGFAAYGYGSYVRHDKFPLTAGRRHHVACELKAGLQTLELDGRAVPQGTDTRTIDTGANLYVGACNFVSRGNPALYASQMRLYALKIWQTDSTGAYRLVRDFAPCMAAGGKDKDGANRRTRVGALYDRVSGRLFFAHKTSDRSLAAADDDHNGRLPDTWNTTSAGRPDFFVEYIRSTGSQILDTGIPARAGLKAEGDVYYTDAISGAESTFLGASGANHCMIVDRVSAGEAWGGFGTYSVTTRYFTNETTGAATRWELNVKHHFTAIYGTDGESTITQDGATVYRASNVAQSTGYNLMVFADRRYNYPAYTSAARCYGLKLWLDGELVRDFRPCVKGGKAGLYDEVRNEVVFPLGDMDINTVGRTVNEDGSLIAIPWVQTTSTQYVDLGVIGRSGTKIEMDFLLPEPNNQGDHGIIGARGSTSTDSRFYPIHQHQDCGRLGYRTFMWLNDPLTDNERHHVVSELRAGRQVVTVDGTVIHSGTDPTELDTGINLYLGGVNVAGTASYCWPVRVYALKIWQTATTAASDTDYRLVRDFVPACDGNAASPGVLLDRVSGTCYRPGSTSTWESNPDVRFRVADGGAVKVAGGPDALVEYIESDGVQMIDTGVAIEGGLKAEGELMWTGRFSSEQTHLGSANGGNRLYFCHNAWGSVWFGYAGLGHYPLDPVTGAKRPWKQSVRQSYVVDYTDSARITATIDGETYMDLDASDSPYAANAGTLAVFACQYDGAPNFASKSRCYGFRISKNGAPIHNFLPCVKNGQGGLYDTVTDEVYLPVMGSFTGGLIGPMTNSAALTAKHDVEYVESDGNGWLDTGVTGRSGTKVKITFTPRWTPLPGNDWSSLDMGLIGARTSQWGDNRFYPVHSFGGAVSYGYCGFASLSASLTDGAAHTIESELRAGCQRIVLDGEEILAATDAGAIDTGLTMYLGAVNVGGEAQFRSPVRIHGVKIWQTATTAAGDADYILVRDYQPAVTAGGVLGLQDAVSGTFAAPKTPYVASGKRMPRGFSVILR